MEIRYTKHSLERLFSRKISPEECEKVLENGEVIEEYPDDTPYPSKLLLGRVSGRFLHLVVSYDGMTAHIITAYEPKPMLWSKDFRKRIK